MAIRDSFERLPAGEFKRGRRQTPRAGGGVHSGIEPATRLYDLRRGAGESEEQARRAASADAVVPGRETRGGPETVRVRQEPQRGDDYRGGGSGSPGGSRP